MVAVDSTPQKKNVNEEIISSVLKKIGGKPSNFYKATCTQVHANSYRVNIWTEEGKGEFGIVKNPTIFHSEFYFLKD